MIGTVGNYVKTSHKKEELIDLCKTILFESIHSFGHFVDLLDIDSNLFAHLLDIEFNIDYTDSLDGTNYISFYYFADANNNNGINISAAYLDDMLTNIENGDVNKYKVVIDEITSIVLHEAIHGNRSLMVKDGLNTYKLLKESKDRQLSRENNGKLREELDNILIDKINNNVRSKIVLLKVVDNNVVFTAYVYNSLTKQYEVYNLNRYRLNLYDYVNTYQLIDSYLNDNLKNPSSSVLKPTKIISVNNDNMAYFADDYAAEIGTKVEDLSDEELDRLKKVVSSQIGLEEVISEAISRLMVYHVDKEKLDIHGFCNKMLNDKYTNPDMKLGYQLLDKMSLDDIRWFMLSVYDEEYSNRFKKLFKEDYETFILDINKIHNSVVNKETVNQEKYEETEEMISKL